MEEPEAIVPLSAYEEQHSRLMENTIRFMRGEKAVNMLLLGGMVIAIGLFISSLTESQFIAALGTFVVSFAMIMVDSLGSVFSSVKWITSVVNFISVSSRYSDFTSGVINYDNVVFFLSLQALFVFLTVRVLDRKRWS